jgi:transcriptional regulator with XRE-family HTH domain
MDLRRVSHAIRALRMRRGWRQADLARAAKLSRSVVGRVERGERDGLALDAIVAVAEALDATVFIEVRWHGEALDRLLDEGHAALVDRVVAWLRAIGWEVAVEVSFPRGGERGSIDVLAWHPVRRALVVIEVKSVTPDVQAMLYGIDRKARLGPAIAHARGWDVPVAARLLVVWDTRTNRRRIEAHASSIRAALPAGTQGGGRLAPRSSRASARRDLVRVRCPGDGWYGRAAPEGSRPPSMNPAEVPPSVG